MYIDKSSMLLRPQSAKQETQSTEQEMQETEQETQETEQETQSTKQILNICPSDLGYKLLMQYYNKLTSIPSLVDLTSHFVAANVITSSDEEAITNTVTTKSQTAALRELLMLMVCHSDNKPFCKALGIMQTHGNDTSKALAAEMLEKLLELSTDTGTYVYLHI